MRVNPWLVVFSRLRLSHAPVVNSPPTVKPEIFCALAAVGKSFRCPGGSGMGLALLAVIWLITLVSTYFFVAKTWWLPVGAAEAAGFIDHQFALTYVLMGIVFLAAQLGLGYLAWRYREHPSAKPAQYSHGNTSLEVIWTVLTAVLFTGLKLMRTGGWAGQHLDPAAPNAVQAGAPGVQCAC